MWWSQVALGLKLIWFGFKCSQVASSDMNLELFWSHVTSPQPHPWHSQLFCFDNDCHLFKFLLQHLKTVALVQSAFEFKRGHIFYCCQNWSNQFCKIQKNARFKDFKVMEFCALYLTLKNSPKALFYLFLNGMGVVGIWVNFPASQKLCIQFLVIKLGLRVFKIYLYIF